MIEPWLLHVRRGREFQIASIEDFSRPEKTLWVGEVIINSAGDQDIVVLQPGRYMTPPRESHTSYRSKVAGVGIIYFG